MQVAYSVANIAISRGGVLMSRKANIPRKVGDGKESSSREVVTLASGICYLKLTSIVVANAYDQTPWILDLIKYIQHIANNTKQKIIGICFGHQVYSIAMGGKVEKAKSWEVGLIHTDLTEMGIKFLHAKEKDQEPMRHFGLDPTKGWLRCLQVKSLVPQYPNITH
jgi:hypothetical protein